MLAVGEHALGKVDGQALRMATGFSGGVGDTRLDLCGALSAGIMIIGALQGRMRPDEDERQCLRTAASYRNRFAEELGSAYCHELRAAKYGSQGQEPCSVLVERAARILLEVLDDRSRRD